MSNSGDNIDENKAAALPQLGYVQVGGDDITMPSRQPDSNEKATALQELGYVQVRDDDELTMPSREPASVGPRPSSRSLIDSTLAQACALKRACADSSKEGVIESDSSITNVDNEKALELPQLGYVQVRDDDKLIMPSRQPASVLLNGMTLAQVCSLRRACADSSKEGVVKRAGGGAAKFGYKDRTPGGGGLKIAGSGSSSNAGSGSAAPADVRPQEEMCPYTFITKVLLADAEDKDGSPSKALRPLRPSEFLPVTDEQVAAYSNDVLAAVRRNDVEALRRIRDAGRTLRCCNRFGESLLHAACRNSSPAVVRFLLREADVDPRVRDDYGRTPLHDACWRGEPEYDIAELLLEVEPRLALARDVRGHDPFMYARREHWGGWREFLGRRRDLFLRRGEEHASLYCANDGIEPCRTTVSGGGCPDSASELVTTVVG